MRTNTKRSREGEGGKNKKTEYESERKDEERKTGNCTSPLLAFHTHTHLQTVLVLPSQSRRSSLGPTHWKCTSWFHLSDTHARTRTHAHAWESNEVCLWVSVGHKLQRPQQQGLALTFASFGFVLKYFNSPFSSMQHRFFQLVRILPFFVKYPSNRVDC